jgi:hypothetical protein
VKPKIAKIGMSTLIRAPRLMLSQGTTLAASSLKLQY